jgi:hypothetical protein
MILTEGREKKGNLCVLCSVWGLRKCGHRLKIEAFNDICNFFFYVLLSFNRAKTYDLLSLM